MPTAFDGTVSWNKNPIVVVSETVQTVDKTQKLIGNVIEDLVVKGKLVADEVISKNQCTAWVNFDGTTTPPTIRDSHNVSDVTRTATGRFDVYFEEPMDTVDYCTGGATGSENVVNNTIYSLSLVNKALYKASISTIGHAGTTTSPSNYELCDIQIFGGKN